MTTSDKKSVLILTALIAVLLIGSTLLLEAKAACAPPGIKEAVYGCLEYWINRYQTLIAAVMGAAVALIVVRPVFAQLREMARQSSKGAKELAESFAAAVDDEVSALKEIRAFIEWYTLTLHDFEMEVGNVDPQLREEARRFTEQIKSHRAPIERNDRRQIADQTVVDTRKRYLGRLGNFLVSANDYSIQMTAASRNPKRPKRIIVVNNVAKVGKENGAAAIAESDALIQILDDLSRQKWAQVRELERKAQGFKA